MRRASVSVSLFLHVAVVHSAALLALMHRAAAFGAAALSSSATSNGAVRRTHALIRRRANAARAINYASTNRLLGRRTLSSTCLRADQDDGRDEMDRIANNLTALNEGRPINVNSPTQVATAIFGSARPVPREVLLDVVQDEEAKFTKRQRAVADLVLKYRDIQSRLRREEMVNARDNGRPLPRQPSLAAAFSTSAGQDVASDATEADETEEMPATDEISATLSLRQPSSGRSPYGQLVDSLFASEQSQLDPYWHEALDKITKPSARALVSQLDPYQCPMGYDPAASPFDVVAQPPGANDGVSEDAAGAAKVIPKTTANTTQGKKGSLLAFVREQKEKFSDCVVITRVGDFYECFGIDAILLIEYCGLNAMAGKARAGCPIKNIQATLDCLTTSGFRVAVYEEATDTDASVGGGASAGSKSRLKQRMLAQIISSASPTYLYDLILGNGDTLVTSPTARPHVGIISESSGYTIVEVSSEERTVRVSERRTAEAVSCALAAYPPADPLFYVPSPSEERTTSGAISSGLDRLPFLPSRSDPSNVGPGSRYRVKILPSALLEDPSSRLSDVDRAKKCIVSALLQISEFNDMHGSSGAAGLDEEKRVTHEDFVLVESSVAASQSENGRCALSPLYAETATQLGLMSDPTIPSLVSYLLPDSAPAPTRRFLRRWLLTPPPPRVADAMAVLVKALKENDMALPPLAVPPLGKVLSLIRAGQASAQVYREILAAMDATVAVLDTYGSDPKHRDQISALSILVQQECGIAADPVSVRDRCLQSMHAIDEVVATPQHSRYHQSNDFVSDPVSDYGELIPGGFLERNEATWRGRIKVAAAEQAYRRVRVAADALAEAVASDFWGLDHYDGKDSNIAASKESKSPILQDIFNNIFAIKTIPTWAEDPAAYYHPRDRNGKLLRSRYTTERVDKALHEYVAACEGGSAAVTAVLAKLAERLCDDGHLPAVVQASHTNLILSTAAHHSANANALGWNQAAIVDSCDDDQRARAHFEGLYPYWMDSSESVPNTFTLDGLFLLTAPNMSGKSTLMRSTAAASLLTVCGLCAPLQAGSFVQRFDNIFVRGASADVPTESKSAFGAEMGDVAALMRACGEDSLVFVDELGRGTSPKDGTSLAGAVLEAMASAGMTGFFATHLHGIFKLPLVPSASDRIKTKRMVFTEYPDAADAYSGLEWTYKMEDGTCTQSHALVTAARFGLPAEILSRAEALSLCLDTDGANGDVVAPSTIQSPQSNRRDKSEARVGSPSAVATWQQPSSSFNDAVKLVEEVACVKAAIIPPRWMPPPSLEGTCCVYLLEIGADPPQYYVGETDSLSRRLSQHRRKGPEWAQLRAAAVPVPEGKSDSRSIESLTIRKLAKAGYDLLSIADGRVVRKGSNFNL